MKFKEAGYHLLPQGMLAANFIHQDFLDLVGSNKGDICMCYVHGQKQQQKCGACFMDKVMK